MAKSFRIILLLAFGLGFAGPVLAAMSAAPALLSEVQAALDSGDAAQAQRLADTALRENPDAGMRARLLLARGLARELLGDHDKALADFTAAIDSLALPPDDRAQALLQRGFLRDGLGQLDAAARDYSLVIALRTDLAASALNNRANIYRRQGRLGEAWRDYLAALQVGGSRAQYPYYGLGQIAEAQHDTDAARGYYAKAVAADPGYRLAADRLAQLGGPPDATLSQPDVIHLRPPPAKAQAAGDFTPVPPVPDRIVLKPPRARSAGFTPAPPEHIVLNPPPPRTTSRPAPAQPPAKPGLRPALDAAAPAAHREVQLGAWRSRAEAEAGWQAALAQAPAALAGLSHRIVQADLSGRGTYYRLRAAAPDPAGLCGRLTAMGLACLPARD